MVRSSEWNFHMECLIYIYIASLPMTVYWCPLQREGRYLGVRSVRNVVAERLCARRRRRPRDLCWWPCEVSDRESTPCKWDGHFLKIVATIACAHIRPTSQRSMRLARGTRPARTTCIALPKRGRNQPIAQFPCSRVSPSFADRHIHVYGVRPN